jgi:hypothetical protein
MVKFQTKMDSLGKIYIAKPLRRSGLVNTIEIVPNSKCAVIYQAGTKTKDVIAGLEVIVADLRNCVRMEAEET